MPGVNNRFEPIRYSNNKWLSTGGTMYILQMETLVLVTGACPARITCFCIGYHGTATSNVF